MRPEIIESEVDEGTDNQNVGRIEDHQGNAVLRSQCQSWELSVIDEETRAVVYSLSAQPTSDTAVFFWFDTPQKTGEWNGKDATGFNMLHNGRIADVGAGILKGGRSYLWEYAFISSTLGRLPAKFRWIVNPSHLVATP
jgi:hypothetical protein